MWHKVAFIDNPKTLGMNNQLESPIMTNLIA